MNLQKSGLNDSDFYDIKNFDEMVENDQALCDFYDNAIKSMQNPNSDPRINLALFNMTGPHTLLLSAQHNVNEHVNPTPLQRKIGLLNTIVGSCICQDEETGVVDSFGQQYAPGDLLGYKLYKSTAPPKTQDAEGNDWLLESYLRNGIAPGVALGGSKVSDYGFQLRKTGPFKNNFTMITELGNGWFKEVVALRTSQGRNCSCWT